MIEDIEKIINKQEQRIKLCQNNELASMLAMYQSGNPWCLASETDISHIPSNKVSEALKYRVKAFPCKYLELHFYNFRDSGIVYGVCGKSLVLDIIKGENEGE